MFKLFCKLYLYFCWCLTSNTYPVNIKKRKRKQQNVPQINTYLKMWTHTHIGFTISEHKLRDQLSYPLRYQRLCIHMYLSTNIIIFKGCSINSATMTYLHVKPYVVITQNYGQGPGWDAYCLGIYIAVPFKVSMFRRGNIFALL